MGGIETEAIAIEIANKDLLLEIVVTIATVTDPENEVEIGKYCNHKFTLVASQIV